MFRLVEKLHNQIKLSHKFITSFIKGLKAKIQELPKTIMWLQLFFSTAFEKRSYAWKIRTVCKGERGCMVTYVLLVFIEFKPQ